MDRILVILVIILLFAVVIFQNVPNHHIEIGFGHLGLMISWVQVGLVTVAILQIEIDVMEPRVIRKRLLRGPGITSDIVEIDIFWRLL